MLAPPTIGKTKTLTSCARRCSRTRLAYRRDARPEPRMSAATSSASNASVPNGGDPVRQVDARQRHLVGDRLAHLAPDARLDAHVGRRRQVGVRGDRAEVALDHGQRRIGLEVAGHGEDRVVRRVVGGEELAARPRATRPTGPPSSRWSSGGTGATRGRRAPACARPRPVRLVVDAPAALVLHDVALVVELLLRHRRQERGHPIGLEPQRQLELVAGERLEVVRAVEPGRWR